MNPTSCVLLICVALTSFLNVSGEACYDKKANCAFMKSFCVFDLFLNNWCRKTCENCGGAPPTDPPTRPPTRPPTTAPTDPVTPGTCGRPLPQSSRVIAGQDAKRFAWPWQILMVNRGYPSCGGTIIDKYWIVTAAHCVDRVYSNRDIFIRTGEHDMRVRDGTERDYDVAKIIIHERWSTSSLQNDIALIKLTKPIQYSRAAMPACLPDKEIPVGSECFITGWGKIEHPGQMHSRLQQARMPVVDSKTCERQNWPYTRVSITKGMVCAGHGGKTDVSGCHGDSGGPFVCNVNGRFEIHGAVSHGSGDCDAQKTYSVFSRITEYRSWMANKMAYN